MPFFWKYRLRNFISIFEKSNYYYFIHPNINLIEHLSRKMIAISALYLLISIITIYHCNFDCLIFYFVITTIMICISKAYWLFGVHVKIFVLNTSIVSKSTAHILEF